jgi:hypothetical protein
MICLPLDDFVRGRGTKLANYRQKPAKVNAARPLLPLGLASCASEFMSKLSAELVDLIADRLDQHSGDTSSGR